MKLWLDDVREPPAEWESYFWASNAPVAIEALATMEFDEVSLDHDLGPPEAGEGYDVLLWIEERVRLDGYVPPKMSVHSANSPARARMERAIAAIDWWYSRTTEEGQ